MPVKQEAYCVRCKKFIAPVKPEIFDLKFKNKFGTQITRKALKGNCPVCKSKVSKFVSRN